MKTNIPSPNTTEESSLKYPGWIVVLASMAALMFGPSTIVVFNLGLFMGPIQADFGWSRADVALASTVVAYTVMAASPLQGYLVDRFGARNVILPCIPLFAFSIASLYFLPPNQTIYYLAWFVIPLLGAGIFPLSYLRVVSSWFSNRLGLALGLTNAGVGLGGAVVPLITTALITHYGWRVGFLGLAGIALFATLPIAWLYIRDRAVPLPQSGPGHAPEGIAFGDAVRDPQFKLLVTVFFLLGFPGTALVVHQFPMLVDGGMSVQRAALVQATYGIFVIVGRLLTGVLLDLLPARKVMLAFTVGGVVACALYAYGISGDAAFISAMLLGLLIGAEFDVLAYILRREFGMKSFGKLYGLTFAMFQFASGLGAAVLPITQQKFGSYGPGLWIFTASLSVAAFLLLALQRARRNVSVSTVHAG